MRNVDVVNEIHDTCRTARSRPLGRHGIGGDLVYSMEFVNDETQPACSPGARRVWLESCLLFKALSTSPTTSIQDHRHDFAGLLHRGEDMSDQVYLGLLAVSMPRPLPPFGYGVSPTDPPSNASVPVNDSSHRNDAHCNLSATPASPISRQDSHAAPLTCAAVSTQEPSGSGEDDVVKQSRKPHTMSAIFAPLNCGAAICRGWGRPC